MRCSTRHGTYQCDRDEGHDGECATDQGPMRRPLLADLNATPARIAEQRETLLALYRKALDEIRKMPCSSPADGASCACCLHGRMVATAALGEGAS